MSLERDPPVSPESANETDDVDSDDTPRWWSRPLRRRPSDDSSYASPRSDKANVHGQQAWVLAEVGTRAIMGEDASPEMTSFQKSCPGDSFSCWRPCCEHGTIEVCRYAAWPGCPSNGYHIVYLRDNVPIALDVDDGIHRSCLGVRPGPRSKVEVGLQFTSTGQREYSEISCVCIHTNRISLEYPRAVIQRSGTSLRRQRRNAVDMTRDEMHALMVGNVLQARLNNKSAD
jgi:hypothetical protein